GACSSAPAARQPFGATRILEGVVKSEVGVDFSQLMAVFLTRGGSYSTAPLNAAGMFALAIPTLDAAGALVLADYVTDPSQIVAFAPLIDAGTGEGLIHLERGTDTL